MSVLENIYRPEYVSGVGTIDVDKGILLGVKVIEIGSVNDARPFYVDGETLEQIERLGNQPAKGVKVRYTHAGSEDAMGSHLGRATNFRIDGDCVRADITLAKSSFISPRGNLGGYVLTLAEEDSLSLGMSVAGTLDGETMSDLDDGGMMPLRFLDLYSADVVADPAATRDGLFSQQGEEMKEEEKLEDVEKAPEALESVEEKEDGKPAAEMTEEPQESPGELSEGDEDKLEEQAEEMPEEELSEEPKEELKEESKEEPEEDLEEEPKEELSAHAEYVETFGSEGAVWFLEGKSLGECFKIQASRFAEEIKSLKAELARFESLKAAGEFALGEEAPVSQAVELSDEEKVKAKKAAEFNSLRSQGMSESDIRWAQAFANK
jgi:hypothetical protein